MLWCHWHNSIHDGWVDSCHSHESSCGFKSCHWHQSIIFIIFISWKAEKTCFLLSFYRSDLFRFLWLDYDLDLDPCCRSGKRSVVPTQSWESESQMHPMQPPQPRKPSMKVSKILKQYDESSCNVNFVIFENIMLFKYSWFCMQWSIDLLRPSDGYMRQKTCYHWFR